MNRRRRYAKNDGGFELVMAAIGVVVLFGAWHFGLIGWWTELVVAQLMPKRL